MIKIKKTTEAVAEGDVDDPHANSATPDRDAIEEPDT